MHIPKSLFCASILKVRTTLLENCTYQISQGNTTNIWTQPWCPIWTQLHDLDNHLTNLQIIASDLWLSDTKQWDTRKIDLIFGAQAPDIIKQVPISNHEAQGNIYYHEDI